MMEARATVLVRRSILLAALMLAVGMMWGCASAPKATLPVVKDQGVGVGAGRVSSDAAVLKDILAGLRTYGKDWLAAVAPLLNLGDGRVADLNVAVLEINQANDKNEKAAQKQAEDDAMTLQKAKEDTAAAISALKDQAQSELNKMLMGCLGLAIIGVAASIWLKTTTWAFVGIGAGGAGVIFTLAVKRHEILLSWVGVVAILAAVVAGLLLLLLKYKASLAALATGVENSKAVLDATKIENSAATAWDHLTTNITSSTVFDDVKKWVDGILVKLGFKAKPAPKAPVVPPVPVTPAGK